MDGFRALLEAGKALAGVFWKVRGAWLWLIPALIIVYSVKYIARNPKFIARLRGKAGEKRVKIGLNDLPENEYKILNDVLISTDYGSAQIDHIIVSVYGIFVIETKNYQGTIYGSEDSSMWTQNIYGNKKDFKNPIHQNYGHIKAIENHLLEYPNIPIKSIIAFNDSSELKTNTITTVAHICEIAEYVKVMSGEVVLTTSDIEKIYNILDADNITDFEQRKAHNKKAADSKHDTEACIKQRICPKCGGKLVERSGTNGYFLGCSNYPRCRFTANKEN